LNCLVKLERISPEGFIAKGVETKYFFALLDHPLSVSADLTIKHLFSLAAVLIIVVSGVAPISKICQRHSAAYQYHYELG